MCESCVTRARSKAYAQRHSQSSRTAAVAPRRCPPTTPRSISRWQRPAQAKIDSRRYSGRWSAYFPTRTSASSPVTAPGGRAHGRKTETRLAGFAICSLSSLETCVTATSLETTCSSRGRMCSVMHSTQLCTVSPAARRRCPRKRAAVASLNCT